MQPYCCANALEEAATGNRCCTWLPSDCRCPILVPPSPKRLLEVDRLQVAGGWAMSAASLLSKVFAYDYYIAAVTIAISATTLPRVSNVLPRFLR
jgi:hypothetical protein